MVDSVCLIGVWILDVLDELMSALVIPETDEGWDVESL